MTETKQAEESGFSWLDAIVVGAAIYFAWRAGRLLDYWDQPIMIRSFWSNADDATSYAVAFVADHSKPALTLLSILSVISLFISPSRGVGGLTVVAFIGLGVWGWWLGEEFAKAVARNMVCERDSFLGLGCSLDAPALGFMGFGALTMLLVVSFALTVLAGLGQRFSAGKAS